MSALEAMACGKPIIETKVGGLIDLISDGYNGLPVPTDDHVVLAKRIVQVLQDPWKAATLGKNARARAEECRIEKVVEMADRRTENASWLSDKTG